MMRSFKVEGVILKRKDLGEADRLLTVFTKQYGKIKVLAKGVRKITSRRSPNIELFNHVVLFVHRGRTFDILTEVQTIDTFQNVRKNLELVGLAYYVCELIDGLCAEHQQHFNVYNLIVKTLQELDSGVIQRFETTLLSELGFLSFAGQAVDTTSYIEQLLERKIKTRRLLAKFS